MALRAKKPESVTKRLKLFMYGPAGVGKTTAAIQFPNSYIVDCERGAENYDKLITASGSVVFQSNDMSEIVQEVRSLATEKHGYRTLVIDPITTAYNDLLEKCELKVGSEFGRHYGEANKQMKRLANLIMSLDMNVIITAHSKKEYGENLKVLGQTFDGWKQLDYLFDLVIELQRKSRKRFGRVIKTRIDTFPDEDVFEWNYEAIRQRYDTATLDREAATVALAKPDQVAEIKSLLEVIVLPPGTTDKWFSKAGVDEWEDMPADVLGKCIDYVKARLPGYAKPANGTKPAVPTPTVAPAPPIAAPLPVEPSTVQATPPTAAPIDPAWHSIEPAPDNPKPSAPISDAERAKIAWFEFIEDLQSIADSNGLDRPTFDRGMVKECRQYKGKEWTMPANERDELQKVVKAGEGYFRAAGSMQTAGV